MPSDVTDEESTISGEVKSDVAELQAENASLRDRMMRALAEAENVRRRAARTIADTQKYAIGDFARELLVVADNLQRAIAAAESEAEDGALVEGVRATERMLMNVFERFGLRRMESLGAAFDPERHEIIMERDDSAKPGTILGVMEDGYVLNDRLLRPARVIVAGRGSEQASDQGSDQPSTHAAP